jgi:hypothetical protein
MNAVLWICITLMRIEFRLITLMRILILFDADLDCGSGSGFLFDADPDPDPTFHPDADPIRILILAS